MNLREHKLINFKSTNDVKYKSTKPDEFQRTKQMNLRGYKTNEFITVLKLTNKKKSR